MKRSIYLVAMMSLAPMISLAQSDDIELQQSYEVQGNTQSLEGAPANGKGQQPIYILNQASPTANAQMQQVQKQPITNIEAAPLTDSRADQIRKQRQELEVNTELKIVEKLEQSRIEDEKRRSEALFGDKFNNLNSGTINNSGTITQTQVVTQQEEAIVAPVEIVDVPPIVKAKIIEERRDELYVGALLGMSEYPDAINVRGNYAAGASVGAKFDDRMLVEGLFVYSNYDIEKVSIGFNPYYPTITSMDQYTLAGNLKYHILGGTFRPYIGGSLAYNYRKYKESQYYTVNGQNYAASQNQSSNALDAGLLGGLDFELTRSFALGLDFRYMWNVTYRADKGSLQTSFVNPAPQLGTPIEELSYYLISVTSRISF